IATQETMRTDRAKTNTQCLELVPAGSNTSSKEDRSPARASTPFLLLLSLSTKRGRFLRKLRTNLSSPMPPVTSKVARRIGASCCKEKNSSVSLLRKRDTASFHCSFGNNEEKGNANLQTKETASNTTKKIRSPIEKYTTNDRCKLV
ncbi:hypothetical protein MUP77_03625, partial [Candidatus Bathyarchaeota archaeon]|nr:hypothetical protein [Candidatus Bathyarchaeota archaeon]